MFNNGPQDSLPLYPGARPEGGFSGREGGGESGHLGFTIDKPPAEVARFYTEALRAAGMETSLEPESGAVNGRDPARGREITVLARGQGSGSVVTVTYSAGQ